MRVGTRRPPPEPHRAEEQRRHQHEHTEGQGPAEEAEHDEHADEAEDVDERGDEAGLQQLRERVDVGGHAGHDSARHLAVVVVERESLQVGEDPDAQREQQSFGGATGVPRVDPGHEPVDERRGEEQRRRRPQRALGVLLHALVETLLHEERSGQGEQRVDDDEAEADEQRATVRSEEVAQPEVLAGRAFGGHVDVGVVVGRRERVDRGEQLGRGCQRQPATDAPARGRRSRPGPCG